MPHLKFTRDHRGYENTFLVDTVRRRGREQSRVLYWFRTPPQVKVGRSAIDEAAIRALEDAYPGVAFDWNRILEARAPEAEPISDDPRRRPRAKGREREREGRREGRPERPAREESPRAAPPARPAPVPTPPAADQPPAAEVELPLVEIEPSLPVEVWQSDETPSLAELPPVPPRVAFDLDGDEGEGDINGEEPAPPAHASEPSAAERMLGSEGLLRLRARHAEVCTRIAAQVADPVRQEALRTLAEQLNPDAWVTEPDVRAGLEQFEQVLDQVRREVGPLRKRTRRGGRRNRRRRENQDAPSPGTPVQQALPTDEPLDDGQDDEGGTDEA